MLRRARRPVVPRTVLQLVPRLDADERGEAALDIARALTVSGWRALIASAGGPLERELRLTGAELIRLPFDAGGPWREWQTARLLARVIRQKRVLLVHAQSPGTATLGAELGRRTGVATVVTAHELPEAKGRRDAGYRTVLKTAGRVIAVSEFAAEHLVTELGLEPERIAVVPCWVDLHELDPDRVRGHRVAAVAERCGLSVGPKVVGVPLDVAATDGCQLLLEAASRLPEQDFVLLFLGRLPEARDRVIKLTAALRAAGLQDRARFGTAVADLPAMLAAIDVLLVPATKPHASASLAVAAQAMGKPVIVTAVGGLPEVVMPAVTGWLLPPDDPGEIAWAIDLALRMGEDIRERVARRARDFVTTGFGAATVLERQLEIYAGLLDPAAPKDGLIPRAAAE